jgi:hypothetical protein
MSVVPLTLTLSLCLSLTFVLFFLREFTRRRFSGDARESLLPLAEETPRIAIVAGPAAGESPACRHDTERCPRKCAACQSKTALPAPAGAGR